MNQSQHILFVETNEDGTVGGSYFCLLEMVRAFAKRNILSTCVFYQSHSLEAEFTKFSEVIVLPLLPAPSGSSSRILRFLENFCRRDFRTFLRAHKILRNNKAIQLVHLNNGPVTTPWLFAAKLRNIPCIAHLRGLLSETNIIQQVLLSSYNRIIAISDTVKASLPQRIVESPKVVRIYDGLDIDAIEKSVQARTEIRRSFPVDGFVVGVVGNIKRWKGQRVAVEAVKLLTTQFPQLQLLLIGAPGSLAIDQAYERDLRRFVELHQLERCVHFVGAAKNGAEMIAGLDALLHTSVNPEPLGRSVLEALCLGTPVIASALGGPCEILEHEKTGLLVPSDDPQALSSAIQQLIQNPELGTRLQQAGRTEVVQRFNLDQNINGIMKLYSELF